MRLLKNIFRAILLSTISLMLIGEIALAAYSYYANVQIQETGGNSYTYLPVIVDVDNDYLSSNGYISPTGLDTRILSGGTELKHLVADDKTLFVAPSVGANSTGNYRYTLGNSLLSSFPVITGHDGYVTIADDEPDDFLELDDNFEIEVSGYIDTSAGADKNVIRKTDAFYEYVNGDGTITAVFNTLSPAGILTKYPDPDVETNTVDGVAYHTWADGQSWAVIRGGGGTGADDNDASGGVTIDADVDINEWDSIRRAILLFDTSTIPEGVYINSATLYLYGSSKSNSFAGNSFAINIYTSNPAANTEIVAGDYDSLGTAELSTEIAYADWGIAGYNEFVLDTTSINTSGITKLGARESNYDAPNTEPSWENDKVCQMYFYLAEQGGTTNDPKLVVDYEPIEVSAVNVDSNEHTIKTWADSTNLYISIDYEAFESYTTGDDTSWYFYSDPSAPPYYYLAQTFTPTTTHNVTDVDLKLYRVGNPGDVTVSITATDGNGHPTGADLCSGTTDGDTLTIDTAGEWRNIPFTTTTALTASTKYAIVCKALTGDGLNKIFWRSDETSPAYSGGCMEYYNGSWVSWDGVGFPNNDLMFEEHGVLDADWYDFTPLNGIAVIDNANDWILFENNVMPYVDYYKHTVSSDLMIWYQPVSLIIGTNLDDREGTDIGETGTVEEDGIITWGTNPADMSITIGSLISVSQPEVSPAEEEEAPDIIPEGNVPITGGVVNTSDLQDNPLYPVVELVNEQTGFTEEQIWFIGATLIIVLGMGIAAVKVPNHMLLAGSVGLILAGFFTAMQIYQWWMMLIFGFMFIMSILMERKPVL